MKKVIYFFALVVTTLAFTSCNTDDSPEQDQLIGKWKLIQEFENNIEYQLECDDLLLLDFKSDGAYTVQYFDFDNTQTCVLGAIEEEGTWTSNGSNSYTLTFSDGPTTIDETITITFENNTFTVIFVDGSDTYKSTYQRQ